MAFVNIEHVILWITLIILLVAFSPLFLNVMSTFYIKITIGNTDPVVSVNRSRISITIQNFNNNNE